MPIEDVDYLKKNSIRQSYMFLVDSADRDRLAYPTPSEYVVEFTSPFANVIGMEVLDASIPRTMYNIDSINNTISFLIHNDAYTFQKEDVVTKTLTPGEYTIQTLIPELNRVLGMNVNNHSSNAYVNITVEATTNPPDVRSTIRFHCPYPFFLDMKTSTIAETLGFDTYMQESETQKPLLEQNYTITDLVQYPKLYHSVDIPANVQLGKEYTAFEGPRGVIRSSFVSAPSMVAQRFTVNAKAYLNQVFLAIKSTNITNDPVDWYVYTGTMAQPNMSNSPVATGTVAISFVDGTLSDSNKVSVVLLPNTYYWLVVSTSNPDTSLYYNDVLVQETTYIQTSNNGASWTNVDTDGVYYQMSAKIVVNDEYHMITAPGIYSLVGPRYIVLRCKEIEENSFRSLSYSKHHLGLAKFRLGVVGYSENRLDFSKVPLREFHPIGKLKRLSLRFELSSGELYDFKGVNHTITFAIHYYEPIQKIEFSQSILNPNYKGNFMNYMYKQDDQEPESEDDEEDFSRDRLMNYRSMERRYLPDHDHVRNMQLLDTLYNEYDDEDEDDEDDED